MPALRLTAYKIVVELLKEYGYYQYCDHSLSNNYITYRPMNSFMAFLSIDNPERIKSSEWNVIHVEEANEFQYNDFMIFKTRLSAPTEIGNKIILSFNPVSAQSWIKTNVVDKEADIKEIVSNYKDNPFLSKEYIKTLESLKDLDANYWAIYGLGEWGVLEHIIYSNYDIITTIPDSNDIVYGLDFGYNHPLAFVEIRHDDGSFFVREKLYQSGLTNQDFIDRLKRSNIRKSNYIYADGSRPEFIEEISRAGYNIHPADKGPGSVRAGIDFCKRSKLGIFSNSINLINEIRSYSWAKNKDGVVLEEPIKFNDDCLDAMRYAMYSHWGNRKNEPIFLSI